jgi:signal transduction histidine kinase
MRLFRSIKRKLIIFALSISLIPIFIITSIYYLNARSTVKNQIIQGLRAVAESKKMHILSFMEAKKVRTIDFSSDGFIRDSIEIIAGRGGQSNALVNLKRHLRVNKKTLDQHIVAIFIVGLDGRIIASTDDEVIGKDVSENEIFVKSLNKKVGETYVGRSHRFPYLNADCIFISAPIVYRYGTGRAGIIINAYDLTALSEITSGCEEMSEIEEVYLVNRDRMMLTGSRFIEDAILKQIVDTEPIRRIISGDKEMDGVYPGYRGVPIVGASMHIPEYGWILLVEMDKENAFASLKIVFFVAIIVGGVSAAAATGVGLFFSISVTKPISKLKDATDRFARGDKDYRVNITNKDEVGDLASSFFDMAKKLTDEIEGHKHSKDKLVVLNKELEAFSYSVSHDLRAPLRSIEGFSKILEEDYAAKLDSQGRDYFRRIQRASRHMSQLIDDLLKLFRITHNDMKFKEVNLSAIVQEIAKDLRQKEPDREVEFVIAKGITVNGDDSLLQIMLTNLLDNAWKFTGKHPLARIEFGITHNDGKKVYFVSDDGSGFEMKYVGKLFTAFQRLHSEIEFEGTGIGLVIVQRIIRRHGGHIWAEGKVEHGATFYFTL